MLYFQPGSRMSYSIGPRPGRFSGPFTTPCSRSRRSRSAHAAMPLFEPSLPDPEALGGQTISPPSPVVAFLIAWKLKTTRSPGGADLDAFVKGADRVRGVLDDHQAVLPRRRAQRVEVRRLSGVVDRHDRARSRSDPAGGVLRIEAERLGVHVGEDRPPAGQLHHVRRRRPRQRRNDHLLAGFQVQERDGQVQSARGRVDGDGVLDVQALPEHRLEPRHLRPGRDPAGAERLDHLRHFFILDRRAAKRQKVHPPAVPRACPPAVWRVHPLSLWRACPGARRFWHYCGACSRPPLRACFRRRSAGSGRHNLRSRTSVAPFGPCAFAHWIVPYAEAPAAPLCRPLFGNSFYQNGRAKSTTPAAKRPCEGSYNLRKVITYRRCRLTLLQSRSEEPERVHHGGP